MKVLFSELVFCTINISIYIVHYQNIWPSVPSILIQYYACILPIKTSKTRHFKTSLLRTEEWVPNHLEKQVISETVLLLYLRVSNHGSNSYIYRINDDSCMSHWGGKPTRHTWDGSCFVQFCFHLPNVRQQNLQIGCSSW